MALKFSSALMGNDTTWEHMKRVAEVMEDGHWLGLWTNDHFMPPMDFMDPLGDCLEGWTTLSGLAAITRRLRLGCLVSGNTYRNPALLAKIAATLDHMTDGRMELGIGAAWHEREHEAYGWGFPSLKERSDRLEEACALIHALFTSDDLVDYSGNYYQLKQAPFAPKCVQRPHIPIMVGGMGERRTLRTLAMYGDIMNTVFVNDPNVIRHKIDVLEKHCEEVGRNPGEIRLSAAVSLEIEDDPKKADRLRKIFAPEMSEEDSKRFLLIGPAAHILDVLRIYQDIGIQEIITVSNLHMADQVEYTEQMDREILAVYS